MPSNRVRPGRHNAEVDMIMVVPTSAQARPASTHAMSLLQASVDVAVIALWLGHADMRQTGIDRRVHPRRPQHQHARSVVAAGAASLALLAVLMSPVPVY
jgi:hypothetical protein